MSFEPLDCIPVSVATLNVEVSEMEELVALLQRRAHAEHALAVMGVNWSAKPLMRAQIITIVARRRLLSEREVMTGRTAEFYEARHEAMWLMRQQKRPDGEELYSFPQIGAAFDQDHTSALNGVRQHEKRLRLHAARGDGAHDASRSVSA